MAKITESRGVYIMVMALIILAVSIQDNIWYSGGANTAFSRNL